MHIEETHAFGRVGQRCNLKRNDDKANVNWRVVMPAGKRKALNKDNAVDTTNDKVEKIKDGTLSKVKQPFRTITRQFEYVKVGYRGLKKKTSNSSRYLRYRIFVWLVEN